MANVHGFKYIKKSYLNQFNLGTLDMAKLSSQDYKQVNDRICSLTKLQLQTSTFVSTQCKALDFLIDDKIVVHYFVSPA